QAGELRPGRHRGRGGAGAGSPGRKGGGCGPGCVRRGAALSVPSTAEAGECGGHAAPGRFHRGSPGEGGRPDCRTDGGLPAPRIQEVRASDPTDYTSLITTTVRSTNGSRTLAGTLFGKRNLRVVRLDDFRFDAVPAGDMLICSNDDRPGMVGILGSILAEARINIATLSLGRDHT